MTRLRVIRYTVHADCVADDGETLTPIELSPLVVMPADWPKVVEIAAESLAVIEAGLDADGGG